MEIFTHAPFWYVIQICGWNFEMACLHYWLSASKPWLRNDNQQLHHKKATEGAPIEITLHPTEHSITDIFKLLRFPSFLQIMRL